MKERLDPKNTVDPAVPTSNAARNLSEKQKQALELADRAEHAIGQVKPSRKKRAEKPRTVDEWGPITRCNPDRPSFVRKLRVRTTIRVGISGWRYSGWRGKFYPKELPQKRELEYASRQVNSIEINGSFYSLQRPENYHAWHQATSGGFRFFR